MKAAEFVRRVKRLADVRGVPFRFEARTGKGSHGRLYYGSRFTTVKDRKQEIGAGLLNAMLSQLGLTKQDPRTLNCRSLGRSRVARNIPSQRKEGSMRSFGFPARVAKGKDGFHTVTFRDVPEAMTDERQLGSAMLGAADALTAALAGYVKEGRVLPKPSKPRSGEVLVFADPSFSAKIVLRQLMAERRISNVGLAKLLKKDEKVVRRMVDPDQPTKLDQLDRALQALGHRVIVGVQPLAPVKKSSGSGDHKDQIMM